MGTTSAERPSSPFIEAAPPCVGTAPALLLLLLVPPLA